MRYSYDFTIPKSTKENLKYEQEIVLDVGIIKQIMIRFKAGCHNRVYVIILDSLEQIAPAKSTQAIYGDNITFSIPMEYHLDEPPYRLIFKGWSPDTRYDHLISVWVDLESLEDNNNNNLLSNLVNLFGVKI